MSSSSSHQNTNILAGILRNMRKAVCKVVCFKLATRVWDWPKCWSLKNSTSCIRVRTWLKSAEKTETSGTIIESSSADIDRPRISSDSNGTHVLQQMANNITKMTLHRNMTHTHKKGQKLAPYTRPSSHHSDLREAQSGLSPTQMQTCAKNCYDWRTAIKCNVLCISHWYILTTGW